MVVAQLIVERSRIDDILDLQAPNPAQAVREAMSYARQLWGAELSVDIQGILFRRLTAASGGDAESFRTALISMATKAALGEPPSELVTEIPLIRSHRDIAP
jgi:hypothetical protein